MRKFINDRERDEEIGKWVGEKTEAKWAEDDLAIGVERDGVLVAGALFNEFNGSNICVHLRCDTPYGLTREFLREGFHLAFKDVQARRLTAPVVQGTRRSLEILMKMGFKCEAILKDYCNSGHLYIMVMWNGNCKYLEA